MADMVAWAILVECPICGDRVTTQVHTEIDGDGRPASSRIRIHSEHDCSGVFVGHGWQPGPQKGRHAPAHP